MKRFWMSGAAAVMALSITSVHAQTTGTQNPQYPRTQPTEQRATGVQQTTTVTGCVYKEADVPGRDPNIAERAGVLEDYILVPQSGQTTRTPGTTGATGTTPPTTTPPTTQPPTTQPPTTQPPTTQPTTPQTAGTTGAASGHKAFKLEHASDDRLRAMVGKMVEVTGKIDAERGDTKSVGTTGAPARDEVPGNPDDIELPEFEVSSIREVGGTCPATPNIRK